MREVVLDEAAATAIKGDRPPLVSDIADIVAAVPAKRVDGRPGLSPMAVDSVLLAAAAGQSAVAVQSVANDGNRWPDNRLPWSWVATQMISALSQLRIA